MELWTRPWQTKLKLIVFYACLLHPISDIYLISSVCYLWYSLSNICSRQRINLQVQVWLPPPIPMTPSTMMRESGSRLRPWQRSSKINMWVTSFIAAISDHGRNIDTELLAVSKMGPENFTNVIMMYKLINAKHKQHFIEKQTKTYCSLEDWQWLSP